ncbi:hypothetical protein C5S53_17625 [Methanophagales archaeon]|nr:hypothetical protein C5S53_17625 [Methanophagales archaeon]
MKREEYNKPEVKSETIEIGAYGQYEGPIPQMDPFFNLCCGGGGNEG